MNCIILLGYMCAGKTTVGRVLAKDLGMMFYDLDWYIEERYHTKIGKIFAEQGEEKFRDLERRMLHEVAEFQNVVLSLGGGTPCFFDNMEYMNSLAESIYLKASPEILDAHLKVAKGARPLLQGKDDQERYDYIKESLQEREPFYMKARHVIDIGLLENYEKVDECVALIREMLKI